MLIIVELVSFVILLYFCICFMLCTFANVLCSVFNYWRFFFRYLGLTLCKFYQCNFLKRRESVLLEQITRLVGFYNIIFDSYYTVMPNFVGLFHDNFNLLKSCFFALLFSFCISVQWENFFLSLFICMCICCFEAKNRF